MSNEDYRIKLAVIAGASRALKFKDKQPKATNEETIKHITENITEIIDKIDEEEF
nr:hypothetical protein [uncultured archaeon]